jgi:hypothetical protein
MQALERLQVEIPLFQAPIGSIASALYAGEAVGLVRCSQPAAAIVADLAAGFRTPD